MEKQLGKTGRIWLLVKLPYIVGATVLCLLLFMFVHAQVLKSGLSSQTVDPVNSHPEVVENSSVELEPNMLYIPSLKLSAPLVYIAGTTETEFQAALAKGVVHYPGTADVGNPGNSYFFGHSSDLPWSKGDYKTVFKELPNVAVGEDIYISDPQGTTFHYKVQNTYIVKPTETWVLGQFEYKKAILSLQTSYPVGTARERFVVQAELVVH